MRILTAAALAAILMLAVPCTSRAADPDSERLVQLVEAYQSGYLQVTAVSCYQIFSSTGLIANAFAAGSIDGPAALQQLAENSLLHSVCYTTLLDIQNLTPVSDKTARAEIDRLARLLVLEDEVLTALSDVFAYPDDAKAAKVEQARARVAKELDAYASTPEK
jgi:hypothetical protein